MRNYNETSVPHINPALSIVNINSEKNLASVEGQFKEIFCDYDVLTDVLSNINGMNSFYDIEAIYRDTYGEPVVINFINTLLSENIITLCEHTTLHDSPLRVGVLGKGNLKSAIINQFREYFAYIDDVNDDNLFQNIRNYDVCVLTPANLTNVQLCDINRFMLKHNKPYIVFGYTGDRFVIGPFVFPWVTECYECHLTHRLAAINSNDEENITINNIYQLKMFADISDDYDTTNIKYLLRAVADDINKMTKNNSIFNFVNKEIYVNEFEFNKFTEKKFTPITDCLSCHGKNKNYIPYTENSKPHKIISFAERDNIKYQVGGFRSVSMEDTEKLVSNTLHKMGIGIKIIRVQTIPYSHIIHVYDSVLETTHKNNTPYFFDRQVSHGKGINEKQAYFSAAFEIFERLSSRYYGELPLIRGTINEVGNDAINLDVFANQIINPFTPYEPYNKDVPVDWVWGQSLITGENKLIPASMVFLSKTIFKGQFFSNTSSGLSAGSTLEDAMLQGLFELIEHDAWIIGQANPLRMPLIDIHSSKNSALLNAVSEIEKMGLKVVSRNYTNDMGIAVVRTWIINPNNYSDYASCGFGASISPELALERSFTEAIQSATHAQNEEITEYSRKNTDDLLFGRYSIYSMYYLRQKDMDTSHETNVISISELPEYTPSSVRDALNYTISRIRNTLPECDILFVDLTREAIGIPVVKMLIVGDVQRINEPIVAASSRMFDFGKKMGYSDTIPKIEELYMGPHPH